MPSSIFLPADDHGAPLHAKQRALIFYVPGNPGLIDFYDDFLRCLASLIRASDLTTAYDIYGGDLRGFRDDDHEPFGNSSTSSSSDAQPWDLNGQVEAVYDAVSSQRRRDNGAPYDFVVMMGHSVGAYITVEVFSRHARQAAQRAPHLVLRNGVLLFPTLTDIALSRNGRQMALLNRFPWVGDRAHRVAVLLLMLVSQGVLAWFMERVMGFTGHAARVTAAWLKSRDGVHQAIHLGRSEMRSIREDEWEEELWEVAEAGGGDGPGLPRFYLYYGRDDEWVASHLRDEFVEKKKGRARVVVDEGDVPHAFCTKEKTTLFIAKKVSEWVEEMEGVRKDKGTANITESSVQE
ncbi:hypothetical protein ACO1O0_003717 [Amphichorda felina]